MRIIGGKHKGKAILPPNGYKARPTTDFAKEGLFNVLDNEYELEGLKVLDLFGGTGAISYEFASRGADRVYCVEMAPLHASFIKSQASKLGMDNLTVVRHNVFEFLDICREKFDIIFADPPYAIEGLADIPDKVFAKDILHKGAYFILEHPDTFDFSSHPRFLKEKKYGNVSLCVCVTYAQTARSLFWCSDSLQVEEIVSEAADLHESVGHCGPAVENSHMALRIYFDDSGCVDVYSKSGRGMELLEYKWNTTSGQRDTLAAGCCEYCAAGTVGLGGIALWDGEKEVRLVATKGRTARVGDTRNGSFAEMIAYGVPYMDDYVDISIRIDMTVKSREAVITAVELSGKKVQFLTGVNFHDGQRVSYDENHISVWGVHPVEASSRPVPVGAGMFFRKGDFQQVDRTDDMVRLVSVPASKIRTRVVAASSKEAELNNAKRFEAYMAK